MRVGKSFTEYVAAHRARHPKPTVARSPYGIRGVNSEEDAAFILAGMGRGPRAAQEATAKPKAKPAPGRDPLRELRVEVKRLRAMLAGLEEGMKR